MDLEKASANGHAAEPGTGTQQSPPGQTSTNAEREAHDTEENWSVFWDEPADRDPDNPMNWPASRKWATIGTLSLMSFLTPLASSMLAPGVPLVMAEFHTEDNQLATIVVSIFVLGFAIGPLITAPLSELYGRTVVYHVSNVLFTIFTVACALANSMGLLVAFRFLAGLAGAAVISCGSGTIADIMPPEQRGRAMSAWSAGPLIGPVLGPVCAGFLVEEKGWRWVFWIIAIAYGAATIVSFFILRETYAPEILERKAARLRKETGNSQYQSKLKKAGSPREVFLAAIVRPSRMFVRSPIIMVMCVYIAIIYGIMYILFTTFTFVYEGIYGFSARGAGLSFIAGGVGNMLALLFTGALSDRVIQRKKASGQTPEPEDRLPIIITAPTAVCLPLGLLMYGWTADRHVHWIAPMIGTGVMGFGMLGIFMSIQVYLIDSYPVHAASATAANAFLRGLLGALLPLCGLQLYDALGIGWGNTLLGLILLVMAPVPWLFATFGRRIRTNPRFEREF